VIRGMALLFQGPRH